MLNEILATNFGPAGPLWSVMSKLSYTAAAVVVGRKFCLAASYKMGGSVAGLLGMEKAANWHKASHDCFTQAKKDVVRDLIVATELIALGLALGHAGSFLENAESILENTKNTLENAEKKMGHVSKIVPINETAETIGRIVFIAAVVLMGVKWVQQYRAGKIPFSFS